jgi:hypothetical protein
MEKVMVGRIKYSKSLIGILLVMAILAGCYLYWEYLPIPSTEYTIEDKTILIANEQLTMTISGVYALSGRYLATFYLQIQPGRDTIVASFLPVKFIADSIPREIEFVSFESDDATIEKTKTFPPHKKDRFEIRLEVLRSNPRTPQDAFSEVTLDLGGVLKANGNRVMIPEFHFRSSKE